MPDPKSLKTLEAVISESAAEAASAAVTLDLPPCESPLVEPLPPPPPPVVITPTPTPTKKGKKKPVDNQETPIPENGHLSKPNFVFVNPAEEDTMIVQHILSMRMGKREIIEDSSSEDEDEKTQDKEEKKSDDLNTDKAEIKEEDKDKDTSKVEAEVTPEEAVKAEPEPEETPMKSDAPPEEGEVKAEGESEAMQKVEDDHKEPVVKEAEAEDKPVTEPELKTDSTDEAKPNEEASISVETEKSKESEDDKKVELPSKEDELSEKSLPEIDATNPSEVSEKKDEESAMEVDIKTESSEETNKSSEEKASESENKDNTPDTDANKTEEENKVLPIDDTEKTEVTGEEKKEEKPKKDKKKKEPQIVEVEEFYVKYKSFSYLHCEWKTEEELLKGDKRVNQKIKRFKQKMNQNSNIFEFLEEEPFNPDYIEVDRILDVSEVIDPFTGKTNKNYLVKWKSLPYEESTWELEDDIDTQKVASYFKFNKPPPKDQWKSKKRPKAHEWVKLDKSPVYNSNNTLRAYQLEGLNWLSFSWHNARNCILADEMGLGKTIQSLTFVESVYRYGIRGPFLILAPLSTVPNWQREFETWTDLNVIVYHGSVASRNMIQEYEMFYRHPDNPQMNIKDVYKFNVLITTFEIVLTDVMELKDFPWRLCIIDEAHRLKNKNCKLLEGLRMLNLEHRVLLSGTPLQNNINELYSLLNFLEPAQFNSDEQFAKEFGELKTDSQVQKLQALLKPMMLRRLKEDVEKSIAPKEETIIEVELTNMQKKYYRAILEKNFSFLSKGTNSANIPNLMNTMMELRKCCIHPYLLNGK